MATGPFQKLRDSTSGPAVIVSRADQIHFNLALEAYLLDVVKPSVPLFFWWRNNRNVVIGRHQNPWKECNVVRMREDGVELSRRLTGGGAVYQDLGNSCFTFLIPTREFSVEKNNAIILDVLRDTFGIHGEARGRNDLTVEGKKFSGAAFRTIKEVHQPGGQSGLSLHHGTLLLNTDFSALQSYLTPHKLKLQSKGVASVAARVANLASYGPVTHDALEAPLTKAFLKAYGKKTTMDADDDSGGGRPPQIVVVDQKHEIVRDPEFQRIHHLLRDWSWRFGSSPQFSHELEHRFDWGIVDLHLDVRDGRVTEVKVFTDSLQSDVAPAVETALIGKGNNNNSTCCCHDGVGAKYEPAAFREALASLRTVLPDPCNDGGGPDIATDLTDWICKEIGS